MIKFISISAMDIPGIKSFPLQAFAKRGMSKLTAEEKVNGIGVLDGTQRGDWKSCFFLISIIFMYVLFMYIYIHCICT